MLIVAAGIFTMIAYARDSANPEAAVSTVLLKTDHSWDGVHYDSYPSGRPELTVLKFVIPPHTTLPWHTHMMPNAAYVVSGTLNLESQDGRHHATLHAGECIARDGGDGASRLDGRCPGGTLCLLRWRQGHADRGQNAID
jgi:hypothetical protein